MGVWPQAETSSGSMEVHCGGGRKHHVLRDRTKRSKPKYFQIGVQACVLMPQRRANEREDASRFPLRQAKLWDGPVFSVVAGRPDDSVPRLACNLPTSYSEPVNWRGSEQLSL